MEQKKLNLPKGIKEASLIDLSTLGLKDDALDRVATKVNAIILEEYTLTKKNSDVVISGIFKKPGIYGYMAFNGEFLKEKGYKELDQLIPNFLKENNIKIT